MPKKPTTHCQICGRGILANTGVIAHHGYERPGDGWQTSSCMGARYRPYEVACDALPPAIEGCSQYIAQRTAFLDEHNSNPPRGIETNNDRSSSFQRRDDIRHWSVLRPAGFDPANVRPNYTRQSYVTLYLDHRHRAERDIKNSTETLKYLKKRLADWKAP